MEVKAIRRKNLLSVIDSMFAGNRAAFARAIERPAPNIHRMLAKGDVDKRGIGEDLARDIEEKLGLEPGFLDKTAEERANQIPEELTTMLASMDKGQIMKLMAFAMSLSKTETPL